MSDADKRLGQEEELLRILGLVEQGAISAADGEALLAALLDPGTRQITRTDRRSRTHPSDSPGAPVRPVPPVRTRPMRKPGDPLFRLSAGTDPDRIELQVGGKELSLELRRLSRQARRMSHEARRIAKRDLKDAVREAKSEIERAFKLSVDDSRRAAREVERELRSVFAEHGSQEGEAIGPAATSWLANLAGLDYNRDRVRHTADVELNQPAEGAARLVVRSTSGDVTVQGWAQDHIEVRGRKVAWGMDREMAQDRAEAMPVEVVRRNGDIVVETRPPVPGAVGVLNLQRMRTDLVIMAPAVLPVSIMSKSGDVVVRDHGAEVDITTTSGDVALHSPIAPIDVETASGDVRLRSCSAPRLSLTSVSGDLTVDLTPQPSGEYRLRSASGDVVTSLEGTQPTQVIMETARGEISTGSRLEIVRRERGRLDGRFPAATRDATGAGDAGGAERTTNDVRDQGGTGKATASLRVVTISGEISVS